MHDLYDLYGTAPLGLLEHMFSMWDRYDMVFAHCLTIYYNRPPVWFVYYTTGYVYVLALGNSGNFSRSGLLQSTSLCLPEGWPVGSRYMVPHWLGCAMIHLLTPEIMATMFRLPSKWASAITCSIQTIESISVGVGVGAIALANALAVRVALGIALGFKLEKKSVGGSVWNIVRVTFGVSVSSITLASAIALPLALAIWLASSVPVPTKTSAYTHQYQHGHQHQYDNKHQHTSRNTYIEMSKDFTSHDPSRGSVQEV